MLLYGFENLAIFASGNGLMPDGTKPLPGPVSTAFSAVPIKKMFDMFPRWRKIPLMSSLSCNITEVLSLYLFCLPCNIYSIVCGINSIFPVLLITSLSWRHLMYFYFLLCLVLHYAIDIIDNQQYLCLRLGYGGAIVLARLPTGNICVWVWEMQNYLMMAIIMVFCEYYFPFLPGSCIIGLKFL